MEKLINKRLDNSKFNKTEDTFMHICTIISYRKLSDAKNKQSPKCCYWNELIA